MNPKHPALTWQLTVLNVNSRTSSSSVATPKKRTPESKKASKSAGESSKKSLAGSTGKRKPHKTKSHPATTSKMKKKKLYCICQTPYDDSKWVISPRNRTAKELADVDTNSFISSLSELDSTWAVIYATIGSTANVSKSPKTSRKHCPNSYAPNASMPVIHKSCFACAANPTMKRNSTYAATSARTGSMDVVWAYCRARPKASMSTSVQIVSATTRWISPTWKRWTTVNTKTWRNSSNRYRYAYDELFCRRSIACLIYLFHWYICRATRVLGHSWRRWITMKRPTITFW